MNDNTDKLLGTFHNECQEKFEIWIKDNDLFFIGDETDWKYISFREDFLFSEFEQNQIITIIINYLDLKGFEWMFEKLKYEL